jgi:hypothetical protein
MLVVMPAGGAQPAEVLNGAGKFRADPNPSGFDHEWTRIFTNEEQDKGIGDSEVIFCHKESISGLFLSLVSISVH